MVFRVPITSKLSCLQAHLYKVHEFSLNMVKVDNNRQFGGGLSLHDLLGLYKNVVR